MDLLCVLYHVCNSENLWTFCVNMYHVCHSENLWSFCVELVSKCCQNYVQILSKTVQILLKICQNAVQISKKKMTAQNTRYITEITSLYLHSFILNTHSVTSTKYRRHTHHPLLIIPYKLVTTRSAQTNIKHFSKKPISLAILVRSLNTSACPPSPLDCCSHRTAAHIHLGGAEVELRCLGTATACPGRVTRALRGCGVGADLRVAEGASWGQACAGREKRVGRP